MRAALLCVALAACGFEVPGAITQDGAVDARVDATRPDAAPPNVCGADPALRLCFSFDQPTLPTSLPNEGAAIVDATLTAITRIEREPGVGAALFDATSSIHVPMSTEVAGILAFETWIRIDAPPASDGRTGLLDSNVIPPNISLFVYPQDSDLVLRCGIGGQLESRVAPIVLGTWHYAACSCDGTSLAVYLDGFKLGETAGACGSAGALVADGLTIGSDNTGNPSAVADRIVGAIDAVRVWAVSLSASQICDHAGHTAC